MAVMARRRGVLAALGAAVAAGGTLAVAFVTRKPAIRVATPIVPPGEPPAPHLAPIGDLVQTDPPVAPPAIGFSDAAGTEHTLADFAGKGVVLNLWATWCVPCVAELPALAELSRKVAPDGIVVLPLSSDRGGAEAVRQYYAAHGIASLGVWLDPKGEAARAFSARGIPTTIIIDREGRERGRVEGAVDWGNDATVARLRHLTA